MTNAGDNRQITVGTTPILVSAAKRDGVRRAGFCGINSTGADVGITLVFEAIGGQGSGIVYGAGIPLANGAGFGDSANGDYEPVQGNIWAIAAAAGAKLSWSEWTATARR